MTREISSAVKRARIPSMAGKRAVAKPYRSTIQTREGTNIVCSSDLDKHYERAEANNSRWDYLICFRSTYSFAVWIELHPASGAREVDAVIRKHTWLLGKLRTEDFSELAALTQSVISKGENPYVWIYQGTSRYKAGGKEARRLALAGLSLPKRLLQI